MAAAAGALFVAVAVTAALRRLRGGAAIPAAVAPVSALVFGGLLLGGVLHANFGTVVGFPLPSAVLLAASACCTAIPRTRVAGALSTALAVAAAVVAARLATTAGPYFD